MRPAFDLMIISDGGPELVVRCARALAGAAPGRVALQLREPARAVRERIALGRALRALTRTHGSLLLINGDVDLARDLDADGVHLPERGLDPREARAQLGTHALVGASRHDAEGLARAAAAGADYATLSPVHAVDGKAPPLGIAGFSAICRDARLPVYALGGVGVGDVAALVEGGARGVAVIREVLAAPDPAAQTCALLGALSPR
ncbi:MAG: thiamine phosphate synthase [Polyangiales bacterium]